MAAVTRFSRQQRPPHWPRPSAPHSRSHGATRATYLRTSTIHLRSGGRIGRAARPARARRFGQSPFRPQWLRRHRNRDRLCARCHRSVQDDFILGFVPWLRLRRPQHRRRANVSQRSDRAAAPRRSASCRRSATIATLGVSLRAAASCAPRSSATYSRKKGDVSAVIAEPMRAVPYVAPPGFWQQVRQACDDFGALLIFDEIPTGLGKTGRLFACEHEGVTPDILVLGKSLGGGMLPIAAVLTRARARCVPQHGLWPLHAREKSRHCPRCTHHDRDHRGGTTCRERRTDGRIRARQASRTPGVLIR